MGWVGVRAGGHATLHHHHTTGTALMESDKWIVIISTPVVTICWQYGISEECVLKTPEGGYQQAFVHAAPLIPSQRRHYWGTISHRDK